MTHRRSVDDATKMTAVVYEVEVYGRDVVVVERGESCHHIPCFQQPRDGIGLDPRSLPELTATSAPSPETNQRDCGHKDHTMIRTQSGGGPASIPELASQCRVRCAAWSPIFGTNR